MKMTAAQCRAARGLLGISQAALAELSGVGHRTIAGFEAGETQPMRANRTAIRTALEAAGVIFVAENGEGPGVRLRKARGE